MFTTIQNSPILVKIGIPMFFWADESESAIKFWKLLKGAAQPSARRDGEANPLVRGKAPPIGWERPALLGRRSHPRPPEGKKGPNRMAGSPSSSYNSTRTCLCMLIAILSCFLLNFCFLVYLFLFLIFCWYFLLTENLWSKWICDEGKFLRNLLIAIENSFLKVRWLQFCRN